MYCFDSFTLDARERRLLRDGELVPLTPKAFDMLLFLVERHGRLVSKEALMGALWGDSHVEEGSLPRMVHVLRKALAPTGGGDHSPRQYIETVPTKGYRFVADVAQSAPTSDAGGVVAEHPPAHAEADARPTRRRAVLLAGAVLALLALAAPAWLAVGRSAGSPRHPSRQTANGAAYASFLSARVYLERRHPGDIDAAVREFESAIRLDATFAAAYAGEADARLSRYSRNGAHDDIAQARLDIRKALELDGTSGYAHALNCRLLATYDWQFAEADAECRRAADLEPGDPEVRRERAFLMSVMGRHDAALKEMDAAIAIAPTSFNKRSRGVLLYFDRRIDEAIAQLNQVNATDPEFREAHRWLARCFEQKKQYGEALAALIQSRDARGLSAEDAASLRQAYQRGSWPAVLRASLGNGARPATLEAAGTLAQLGERDAAFQTLEAMIGDRRVMITNLNNEPRLDPLRSDPRFDQLLKRIGLK